MSEQHYVPRFLLRKFADNKKHFYIFDKRNNNVRYRAASAYCFEEGLYDISSSESLKNSVDDYFTKLEDKVAPLIQKIIEKENLGFLSNVNWTLLHEFIAGLCFRSLNWHEKLKEFICIDSENKSLSVKEKDGAITSSFRDIVRFFPAFANKRWFLWKAPTGYEFYMTDQPVIIVSPTKNMNTRQTIHGDTVPAIDLNKHELYLPISSNLMLAGLNRSFRASVICLLGNLFKCSFEIKDCVLLDTLKRVQVRFSRQWLFCRADDFDIAKQMCDEEPDLRNGSSFAPCPSPGKNISADL